MGVLGKMLPDRRIYPAKLAVTAAGQTDLSGKARRYCCRTNGSIRQSPPLLLPDKRIYPASPPLLLPDRRIYPAKPAVTAAGQTDLSGKARRYCCRTDGSIRQSSPLLLPDRRIYPAKPAGTAAGQTDLSGKARRYCCRTDGSIRQARPASRVRALSPNHIRLPRFHT